MYAINHIPLLDLSKSKTGCCSLINPNDWEGQLFKFENKLFVKARTRSIMHIPINMSSVFRSVKAKIFESGAESDEPITLSFEASPWHAVHYFAVDEAVPGLEMATVTGKFLTKVFEGAYSEAGKWQEQLIRYARAKGWRPLKTYFFYTECPNCAKEYGKNYVIGFEQVARLKPQEN